ncbi:MAG: ATP-binding protein, partial [Paracoccaceae bacterium]
MILRGKARFGPAVIFVLVVIAIGGGLMVSLASGQRAIRDEAALEIARSYASTLRQLQQFYASEVLSHIDPTQVAVTQDYQSAPHAVPMPATLTIDFAEYITRDTPDLRATMRSDQPFYWRDTMLTPFETRALATLRETGGAEVAEFGTNPDGQRTLHYATPITMTGVCVDCHNTHPDSPHTDWAIGDIRGIHVIEAPVGVLGADIPSRSGLLLVAVMSTALMAGLLLALSRAREMAALTDLAARNTELERANAAKDAANRAKSAFIANISHEIRTPLNGLLGLADVLAQDSDTPETRGRVSQMQTAGHSLLRVVNDVLDFSQIEARQMNISTAAFQPEALVEQVVDLFLSDVGGGAGTSSFGPHTDLIVTVAPDVPDWLMGDAFRIKQVLTNLVGNALKFTNSGHVELHMRRDPGNPARLLYEVEDTGIGITESQIARLFQPFSQADGSDTRRHGGTGLGLAISRSLAEQMGGILRVRSIPGVGSTFTLDLPLILAGAYTPVPLPTPPDTLHHVVLWSASAKVGSGVAYALERAGLSVTKAATPQEARAQILAAPDAQHSLLIAAPNGPAPAALANLCGPE